MMGMQEFLILKQKSSGAHQKIVTCAISLVYPVIEFLKLELREIFNQ